MNHNDEYEKQAKALADGLRAGIEGAEYPRVILIGYEKSRPMPTYLKAVRDKETGGIMFLDQFTAMHPDGPDPDRYEVIWLMEIQADQVPIGVEGEANGT